MTPFDICECQHYLTDKHVLGKQFPLSKKVALKNSMPCGSDNLTPLNIGEWQHWSLGLAAATTLWPPSKGFETRCRGVYCIFLVKRAIHICAHSPALKRFCNTLWRILNTHTTNISKYNCVIFQGNIEPHFPFKNGHCTVQKMLNTHRHRLEISEIILKKFKRV